MVFFGLIYQILVTVVVVLQIIAYFTTDYFRLEFVSHCIVSVTGLYLDYKMLVYKYTRAYFA